jgi:hypothetical protein
MGFLDDSTKIYFMDADGAGRRLFRSWEQINGNQIDNMPGTWECSYVPLLLTPLAGIGVEHDLNTFKNQLGKSF